ncbi:hypothetical protein R5R35_007967 [Gryllus longicercus]|uniref:Uncharacterized protein n=1 Tax=Gryllus longicercus TaxID=2509291 RepID=A0AAN9V6U8_9ORTH
MDLQPLLLLEYLQYLILFLQQVLHPQALQLMLLKKRRKPPITSVPQTVNKPVTDGLINNTMPVEKKMTPPESTKNICCKLCFCLQKQECQECKFMVIPCTSIIPLKIFWA